MKKTKMIYLPLLLPVVAIFFWGIFFLKGDNKFDKMVADFSKRKFNGVILKSQEKDRGFHIIEIKDEISNSLLEYNIPKSWFFKENNIQPGDRVSKEPNSKIMTFYKFKNDRYEKCCDYELGM